MLYLKTIFRGILCVLHESTFVFGVRSMCSPLIRWNFILFCSLSLFKFVALSLSFSFTSSTCCVYVSTKISPYWIYTTERQSSRSQMNTRKIKYIVCITITSHRIVNGEFLNQFSVSYGMTCTNQQLVVSFLFNAIIDIINSVRAVCVLFYPILLRFEKFVCVQFRDCEQEIRYRKNKSSDLSSKIKSR